MFVFYVMICTELEFFTYNMNTNFFSKDGQIRSEAVETTELDAMIAKVSFKFSENDTSLKKDVARLLRAWGSNSSDSTSVIEKDLVEAINFARYCANPAPCDDNNDCDFDTEWN